MTLFPDKENKSEVTANASANNRMLIKFGGIFFIAMIFAVGTASATIDTANITDAIDVLGIVGAGFINVLKVIFVDNLATIIMVALIGVILMMFGGFAQMILKFAFSIIGNIGDDLNKKYSRK